jgi:hypothetical protein
MIKMSLLLTTSQINKLCEQFQGKEWSKEELVEKFSFKGLDNLILATLEFSIFRKPTYIKQSLMTQEGVCKLKHFFKSGHKLDMSFIENSCFDEPELISGETIVFSTDIEEIEVYVRANGKKVDDYAFHQLLNDCDNVDTCKCKEHPEKKQEI